MSDAQCSYCHKALNDPYHNIRAAGFQGTNLNFCNKWCYLKYCESLEPMFRKRIALSSWIQQFGRIGKTGKRIVPSLVLIKTRKIMESFYFVEKGE